jgi:RHS repeat-associated protein
LCAPFVRLLGGNDELALFNDDAHLLAGQYFDEESGLHCNRHRYYDPKVGRFISKDPIGLAGGLNAHAYAPNPISWVDPMGLCPKFGALGKH